MDDTAPAYHHGEMDVTEQARTYRAFGNMAKWASLHIAVLVVMLVLWFCLGATFLGGLIPGVILLALGVTFLRATPVRNHDTE
ncbi:MAG: aa3-type cytochrome c oxidase subunit IV [Caulobacteraceae bacterium]|nr:aa3-type cytochrome c oxidase subunit IV [Caulobacteraceae bacterium]